MHFWYFPTVQQLIPNMKKLIPILQQLTPIVQQLIPRRSSLYLICSKLGKKSFRNSTEGGGVRAVVFHFKKKIFNQIFFFNFWVGRPMSAWIYAFFTERIIWFKNLLFLVSYSKGKIFNLRIVSVFYYQKLCVWWT